MVDDDVVCVDAALGQLLDQPLRLIEGEELGDAHADEGGLFLMDVRKEEELQQIKKALNRTHSSVKSLEHTAQWSCIRGQDAIENRMSA